MSVASGGASSAYASFATNSGLTADVNDGAMQDPDFDGIANILEFALGGNPLASSSGVLPTLAVNANDFVFTFNRADESEIEVPLAFQWGTNLVTFPNSVAIGAVSTPVDANGVIVDVIENGTAPDYVTVTLPRTNTVAGKLFGRIQAVNYAARF